MDRPACFDPVDPPSFNVLRPATARVAALVEVLAVFRRCATITAACSGMRTPSERRRQRLTSSTPTNSAGQSSQDEPFDSMSHRRRPALPERPTISGFPTSTAKSFSGRTRRSSVPHIARSFFTRSWLPANEINILFQLTPFLSRTQCGVLAIIIGICAMSSARAEDCKNTIIFSDWKSCAIGKLSANGGDADWAAVPAWTKDRKIQPYFFGEPRMLANHGLCNEKFRRAGIGRTSGEERILVSDLRRKPRAETMTHTNDRFGLSDLWNDEEHLVSEL